MATKTTDDTITFVQAKDELSGSRVAMIASAINQLVEAGGEPLTFDELCEAAGAEHSPQQGTILNALQGLELVGAVERWEYVEHGETRSRKAFALSAKVKVTK
jgi:hypothetical protein